MKGLPYMPYEGGKYQQKIIQFGGIRYGRGGSDGELAESMNLSARQYPALSQSMERAEAGSYAAATAVFGKGKLCVVDGTKFLYDGVEKGTVTEGEKQIVSINTKIVIWPDMVCYDTEADEFSSLWKKVKVPASKATFTGNTLTVQEFTVVTGKDEEGEEGGADPAAEEEETTIKLEELFKENQAVEIAGASIEANNKEIVIRKVEGNTLTFYNDSFTAGDSSTELTIERRVPDLKIICASNNRVWGADDTTIWASALGDPFTWYNYDGLSTDSYAVAVGTDGPFTGCVEYGSNVLFFKEDKLHKVIGTSPKDYAIYTYTIQGIQNGSMRSAQVINEVLYYKGAEGVYAYNGGVPYLVSENFGTRRYGSARAASDGQRYYISMQDAETKEWGLWTLDTLRNIWLKEDDTHVLEFATLEGELLFLSEDGKTLYKMGQPDQEGKRIKWSATFYPMEENTHSRKGYSRLLMRMELAPGAWAKAEIKEDLGPWKTLSTVHGQRVRTAHVTFLPGRCDTFQIRLSGEGRCVVKSLVREFDMGSEV